VSSHRVVWVAQQQPLVDEGVPWLIVDETDIKLQIQKHSGIFLQLNHEQNLNN